MKRYLSIILALLLILCVSQAGALELSGWLQGTCCYPAGSDEETASYVYRYSFPVFSGEAADEINAIYEYEAEYIGVFTLPVNGDMYGVGEQQYYTNLTTRVTYLSEAYASVLLTYEELTGPDPHIRVAAHVFALTGSKKGTVTSLPYVLGALAMDENDEWLIDRQTQKCDACIRRMVWEVLQDRAAAGELTLYDDADEEYLEGCFYPE